MKPKDFQRLLARDRYCLHCGATDALSPNHRANRGMGGSKAFDTPSNLVVLCSLFNGLIESDGRAAALARKFGWKLSKWDDFRAKPVYDRMSGEWRLLNDEYGFIVVEQERE
jgi:hypothetical protein